jgi:hypothetical protein
MNNNNPIIVSHVNNPSKNRTNSIPLISAWKKEKYTNITIIPIKKNSTMIINFMNLRYVAFIK